MSYLDFNRAGMGMLKIFTGDQIEHPADTPLVVKEMRSMLRHLLISKANFEKGSMRCKVDVQLFKSSEDLPAKVVFKNLRDYGEIEQAVVSETLRQASLLDAGETVVDEVRRFDLKT